MEKSLSGIKDVDLKILSGLEDNDLLSFCKLNVENKYVYKLCSDENFWRERTFQNFGKAEKNAIRTWKSFYLNLVYYTYKYKKDSVNILRKLSKLGMKNIDLINYFLHPNEIKQDELILLIQAAEYHYHINLVKYYLEFARKHFSIEEYHDILDHTALAAAEGGDREMLEFLISKGFDDFYYALHGAAQYGHLDIVEFLYSLGARNSRSVEDSIALGFKQGHMTRSRREEIVEFLDQEILKRR